MKEGVGVTRVMRAMQKKLDEEEEERKKAKKTDKKDKKKKKDRKVKKDEEEIGEEEGKEDEPVEKKQKLEEDIEDLDVKPKVQELEAKIKMGSGDFASGCASKYLSKECFLGLFSFLETFSSFLIVSPLRWKMII